MESVGAINKGQGHHISYDTYNLPIVTSYVVTYVFNYILWNVDFTDKIETSS